VDSLGKKVGIVISFSLGTPNGRCYDPPAVALEIQSTSPAVDDTFSVLVCQDGFATPDVIYFDGADCTGQPYLPFSAAVGYPLSLIPRAAIDARGGGNLLYVREPGSGAETIDAVSHLFSEECISGYAPPAVEVVRAVLLTDLNDQFTPPFHLD